MLFLSGPYIDLLQSKPLYVDGTKHTLHHSINFEREKDMEAMEPVDVIWYSLCAFVVFAVYHPNTLGLYET
jgi:hypothetical protein